MIDPRDEVIADLRRQVAALQAELAALKEALALDANLAAALAGKGRLLLLRAKQEGKPERRGEDALQALAALTEAVREKPLLERTHRSDMEEAKRLAGENATEQAP